MTKDEIRSIVDHDNGPGYSANLNLEGYVFIKDGTFLILQLQNIEDVIIAHIKYIHVENRKDFINVMTHAANFMMGNNVNFIFYKEKERKGLKERSEFFKNMRFRQEIIERSDWKYKFDCLNCSDKNCKCSVYNFYK